MKLNYRGISYDYNPITVETTESQVSGKYRGLDWRFRNLKKPPVLQPQVNLTYRGVTYNQPETLANAPQTTENKARTLMFNQTKTIKKRQQSLLRRIATEVGIPENGSNYQNHIQGQVHPTFRANYDRFGATMS